MSAEDVALDAHAQHLIAPSAPPPPLPDRPARTPARARSRRRAPPAPARPRSRTPPRLAHPDPLAHPGPARAQGGVLAHKVACSRTGGVLAHRLQLVRRPPTLCASGVEVRERVGAGGAVGGRAGTGHDGRRCLCARDPAGPRRPCRPARRAARGRWPCSARSLLAPAPAAAAGTPAPAPVAPVTGLALGPGPAAVLRRRRRGAAGAGPAGPAADGRRRRRPTPPAPRRPCAPPRSAGSSSAATPPTCCATSRCARCTRWPGIPLAVAVDDEGGRVQRIDELDGELPSARAMSRLRPAAGARAGPEPGAASSPTTGSPSTRAADLGRQPAAQRRGDRRPDLRQRPGHRWSGYAGAFAQGQREAGVFTVLKHFPGHGHADGDSHRGRVSTPPLDQQRADDLRPLRRADSGPVGRWPGPRHRGDGRPPWTCPG